MPLFDHFHPPLHGPRRTEGFHHAWATFIAQQLNQETLPAGYFAESEISIGPELEVDVAAMKEHAEVPNAVAHGAATLLAPPRPRFSTKVDFSRLENYEVRIYQDLDGAELRAAIELVSPANKDREASRRTLAAKCASYLRNGLGVILVDVVTSRKANLHREVFDLLDAEGPGGSWASASGLYAVSYRAVTLRKRPRVEVWPKLVQHVAATILAIANQKSKIEDP